MDGVQAAIDAFNAETGADLRSRRRSCSRTGRSPMYLDDEDSDLLRHQGRRLRRPGLRRLDDRHRQRRSSGTAAAATRARSRRRSGTSASNRPAPTALPFGVSYERFRNPGPTCRARLRRRRRPRRSRRTPATTHWYGGYESQSDNILDVDVTGDRRPDARLLDLALHRGGLGLRLRRGAGRRRVGDRARWSTTPAPSSRRTTTRTATTPRATASPAPRAARTSSTSRSTCTTRRSCRPARPTCGSATRPTRRTSTPAGSSTTCTVDGAPATLSSAEGELGRDRPACRTTTGRCRSSPRAT